MEEIKTYTLEELIKGKGNYGIAASAVPYNPSLRTYLRITDINDDGTLNKSSMMSVDEKNADAFLLKPNDIVFARTGNSTGRSYFYDGSDGELVYAGFLIKFSLDETKVNPRILKYYTHSKLYYDWVHSFDTGGTRGNINAKTYGAMPIMLPSRDVQNRIVDILKSLDNKIELNRRINDNLEQQAQAWLNELLNKYADSTTVLIHEIAEINPKRNLSKGTSAKCIEMANLPTIGSFPNGWIEKEYNGGMKFRNGDTLIARITPCLENGKTAFINFLDKDEIAYGSTEYIVISTKSNYSSSFFYFLARNHDFVDYAVKNMNGSSGRQRVSGDTIGKYRIPVIPREKLESFMSHAEITLKTIKDNSLQNMRLSMIRDALLPKLMSGELKVNDLNS